MAEQGSEQEGPVAVEPSEKQSLPVRLWKGVTGTGKWIFVALMPPVGVISKALCLDVLWRMCRSVPAFFRRFLDARDPKAPGAPDIHDFNQVLTCWGIEPDDASIRKVISSLKIRRVLVCGVSALFFLSIAVGWEGRTTQLLALGGTGTLFFVGLLTNTWRIRVLASRRFVFFTQWVTGFCKGRR